MPQPSPLGGTDDAGHEPIAPTSSSHSLKTAVGAKLSTNHREALSTNIMMHMRNQIDLLNMLVTTFHILRFSVESGSSKYKYNDTHAYSRFIENTKEMLF